MRKLPRAITPATLSKEIRQLLVSTSRVAAVTATQLVKDCRFVARQRSGREDWTYISVKNRAVLDAISRLPSATDTRKLLTKLLLSPGTELTSQVLHAYFVERPVASPAESLKIIKAFLGRSRALTNGISSSNDLKILQIPLRSALFQRRFDKVTFDLVDLLWPLLPRSSWLLGGLGNGPTCRLKWRKNIGLLDRYNRSAELFLMTQVATAFEELVDVTVENFHLVGGSPYLLENQRIKQKRLIDSRRLSQELRKRGMEFKRSTTEQLYLDYWRAAGGAGFEWCEPDQEPTDLWVRDSRKS